MPRWSSRPALCEHRGRFDLYEECLRLLAASSIGRVGTAWRGVPVVLPVNFVLDGERIVVRSGAGTVVAFEVGDFDPVHRAGWSALVTGQARLLTDQDEVARAALLPWCGPAARTGSSPKPSWRRRPARRR